MKTKNVKKTSAKRSKSVPSTPQVPPTAPIPPSSLSAPQAGLSIVGEPALAMAPSRGDLERKLDLGCGQNVREGYEGVDLYGSSAKHVVDLFKFPWPFADESVDEINCSHFLEHIPAREVEVRDLAVGSGTADENEAIMREFCGKDFFFAFMDECYRIMKPGAWMHVVVPSGRSNRAFWDPTHRRFFMQETFGYLWDPWRKANKLDHYRVKCNFVSNVNYSLPSEEGLRHPEVHNERFKTLWNVTIDWLAELQKLPPGEAAQPVPIAPPVVAG